MNQTVKKFLLIFSITLVIGLVILGIIFVGAVFGLWGGGDIDVEGLTMHQNTTLLYFDPETGEEKVFDTIASAENRVWVDLKDTPKHLQQAFVAIEDERFYEHNGYDLRRTIKATLTWVGKKITGQSGAATLGGSTITQQLVKNITGERDQTAVRKIQEISRATAIEKKLSKDEILELYLNCIYLSQGINGVQTAADLYFDKKVKDLSLAECASIAGITQYPSLYDPFVNPDKNKERQELVLGKMLELGYINQAEYDKAKAETLKFASAKKEEGSEEIRPDGITSYFTDQVIRDVIAGLKEKGYSTKLAEKMIYSGGLKIYTTCNPHAQKAMEEYYAKTSNFPNEGIQSAMVITDVKTGAVVGIVGGIGKKEGSLTLNRATSPRQPGSTIKPIGVYAPAIEQGLITPASVYADKPISYGDWTPRNYDHSYRYSGVNVRSALRSSLNTIPVQILDEMGAQDSYDFLTKKLGITTLVKSRKIDDKVYSDIGLSQLALGGLTDGVTALEMASAFATFANDGFYHTPYTFTEVKDKDGKVILTSQRKSWQAMKPSTAFVMHKMLQEVVSSGTGGGAGISGFQTAGKTGTTSDNNDRWFIGYTPYYAAAVWYGYDIPKEIVVSGNPCIPVFRNVMNTLHSKMDLSHQEVTRPDDVVSLSYCPLTGKRHTEECPTEPESFYFVKGNTPGACTSDHADFVPPEEEGEEDTEGDDTESTEPNADTPDTGNNNTAPPTISQPIELTD